MGFGASVGSEARSRHRVGTQHLDELLDTAIVVYSLPMLNQNVKGVTVQT